jgi:glycosyltransferase involved in cell wall biosynthesis
VAELAVGYILKMYPRFSETFVLNEVLELERQGVRIHIFSLKKPDDGIFHSDVARVRARVTYLPENPLLQPSPFLPAHRRLLLDDPQRYGRALSVVLRSPRKSTLKHFLNAGYIAPLLQRHRIAHVHAHFASTAGAVALHLHRLTGIPYSLTAHAKDVYRNDVDLQLLSAKLETARFAVTVSDFNKAYLSRIAPASRIVRIYNGLDLERFAPNGTGSTEPPLVVGVGRLIEKKGFALLIRACALLRDRGVSFRCAIVGKGPCESELRVLVRDLGLDELVELAGALPRDELLELYSRATVVAAPCVVGSDGNRDGLPTVLVEAMALGVPVVATNVTGIPELVEDGRTGWLVPAGDTEALANAIGRVLEDPRSARSLAQTARERVVRDFDLRRNVSLLRTLFEEALAA